ncbi:MAG TPA: hypothetical protein VN852_01525 [Candidatus Krumholzibacteria bacterium]|nr:hypothetical protein [Candidatus Krumholzibacteria bacterium]
MKTGSRGTPAQTANGCWQAGECSWQTAHGACSRLSSWWCAAWSGPAMTTARTAISAIITRRAVR